MAVDMQSATQSVTSVTPSYRRNGKLFSCEPCRKGKLRCDHNSPVCGRCARRNKPESCVYHPAPLTKPRQSPGTQKASVTPIRTSITPLSIALDNTQRNGLVSPPHSTTPSIVHNFSAFRNVNTIDGLGGTSLGGASELQSPSLLPMATPISGEDRRTSSSASYASPESANMSFRDSKTGFLGPTSYNAVFTENPGSLSVITEPYDAEESSHLPPVSAEKIQEGAEVLSMLRDIPIYQRFTQRWFDLSDGIVVLQPIYRIWIDEIWSEFGRLLQDSNPEQLRSLSELVWRNTRKPMKIHGNMTAQEWAKAASGRNLRWEVVGVILSLVGLVAVNLSNWDSIFDSIREK